MWMTTTPRLDTKLLSTLTTPTLLEKALAWCIDQGQLRRHAQRMLDEGYLLAPGALFHAGHEPSSVMRINFATTQDAQFWEVFGRLRAEQG
jgi:DNA-binding transcriptional MocR family regulator